MILVTSYAGQPSCAEFERQASAGERPRKDYVELARLMGADVVDDAYLRSRATPLARLVGRAGGRPAAQVVEAFLRGGRYDHILAGTERTGLPLALLHKVFRRDRDLVLIAPWPSRGGKAFMLRALRVHTQLRAIISYSSAQLEIAASRLGVPRSKLQLILQPVDERFWQPAPTMANNIICAVGSTERDYETLLAAVTDLDVELRIAAGSFDLTDRALEQRLTTMGVPPNTKVRHHTPVELRELYRAARFAVLPLHDVESDCGVTALTEAMAMGKAVILTRTRGQIDVIEDGVQGIYVPPRDPRALRDAIQHLLAHPEEAERMGRAGRKLAIERHTLSGFVAQLATTLRGDLLVPAGAGDPLENATVA